MYSEGTTDTEYDSYYLGTNDNVGYVSTTSTQQTRLARAASPPRRKHSYWFIWYVVFAVCFLILFVLCWLVTQNAYGGLFFFLWFGIASAIALPSRANAIRYNKEVFPGRWDRWSNSFLCQQCGTTFWAKRAEPISVITIAETSELSSVKKKLPDRATFLVEDAKRYEFGDGVAINLFKAASLYLEAAKQGNDEARQTLEPIYSELSIDELELLSKAGDAGAEAELGDRYDDLAFDAEFEQHDDLAANRYWKKSTDWFRRAAEQGNAQGLYGLASAYFHGNGVGKDTDRAQELCKQSVAAGYRSATSLLQSMLEQLEKVEKDERAAVEKEEKLQQDIKSAQSGDLDALRRAGIPLICGNPPRDRQLGLSFLRKAAEAEITGRDRNPDDRRDASTMWMLAMFLEMETSSTEDEQKEAVEWLWNGFRKGDQTCSFMLGEHLARGKGCTKNLILAQMAFEDCVEKEPRANHELGLIYLEKGFYKAAISQFTCALHRDQSHVSGETLEQRVVETRAFRTQAERHLGPKEIERARRHGEALAKDALHLHFECDQFELQIRKRFLGIAKITDDGYVHLWLRSGGIYSLACELVSSHQEESDEGRFLTDESFSCEGEYPFGWIPRPDLSQEAWPPEPDYG